MTAALTLAINVSSAAALPLWRACSTACMHSQYVAIIGLCLNN